MENDPNGKGLRWDQRVTNLENYIIENGEFPEVDKDNHDLAGVSGATIFIDEFQKTFTGAIKEDQIPTNETDGYLNLFTESITNDK